MLGIRSTFKKQFTVTERPLMLEVDHADGLAGQQVVTNGNGTG